MHAMLMMKSVTSVNDENSVTVAIVKNILLSSYLHSTETEKWTYCMSALREEE